ncbi:probable pectinesterase 29 [Tanacetum coccineum]
MELLHRFVVFLALFMGFGYGSARRPQSALWRGGGAAMTKYETIVVDQSGNGNYSSIQAAIDAIPSNNMQWICVYVKEGTYNEQVKIPKDKPMIYLKGAGKRKTNVVWGSYDAIDQTATFNCEADEIVVKSMTFINSYNYPCNNKMMKPALAAKIIGDRSAFYRVGFMGFQDTLWDARGRHYFKLCSIRGAVDFIMGSGQSIYERCTVSVIAGCLEPGQPGFITAQSRENPNHPNGFIFKDCKVVGNGTTYLGRPWRGFARVLFYNSTLTNVVVPEGWIVYGIYVESMDDLAFAEYACRGEGAKISGRTYWEKNMSKDEIRRLTSMSYIDEEGWMKNQPFNMLSS